MARPLKRTVPADELPLLALRAHSLESLSPLTCPSPGLCVLSAVCWKNTAAVEHGVGEPGTPDVRNTVGNIPMEWYQDYPHVGYDLDGKRIYKPIRTKDELDKFLDKMENPDYWRTVQDKQTGVDVRLTDEQVELVQRLQKGQFGDVHLNPYEVGDPAATSRAGP
ncbi:ribosome biogenesis protein bop1-like, partial [Terrapene carolina triunguis]|uniref:ribosome biogenesis protein bop1-like n=1 Tax=Terrapene triunguis TaxID=2587831 RepID=UPI0011564AC1